MRTLAASLVAVLLAVPTGAQSLADAAKAAEAAKAAAPTPAKTYTNSELKADTPPAPAPGAPTEPPALEILSKRGQKSSTGRYCVVEGEVRNLTSQPLRSVQVVVSWYDTWKKFLTSDSAMLEFNPLGPGQRSPFKTMTPCDSAMSTYRTSFKTIRGESLPSVDRTR